ncbi:LamG-like jellyroll fold domain-containing protein [Verrucomicrobiota bacterium sgz303538]
MNSTLLVVVLGCLSVPAAGQQSGLVAAYSFDEGSGSSAGDSSGNGYMGTVNGATWLPGGRFGSALSFNGTGNWVTVTGVTNLRLSTGMTLEAWVNPSALSGWRTVIFKENSGGLDYALYAHDNVPRPAGYINMGNGDISAPGSGALPLNSWTHLATTYDGTTLRLYVNGVLAGSRASGGAIRQSALPLRIGGNSVWGEYFTGLIDEVRIYNRALTATEIQADMTTPIGLAPPQPPGATPSTIGEWGTLVDLGLVAVNMVHLHTGKILMYGGEDHGGTSATLWDLASGVLKPIPAPYNIFCSGHSALADGRILVVGGHEGVLGAEQAAIFDPALETWTQVPNMAQKRWYPTATTLPDGRVLVTSGGTTCFDCIADIPEIYDPRSNSWTQLTGAQLAFPYYPFIFVLPDGRILNAGAGEHPAPARTLDITTQTWATVDPVVVDGGSAVMYRLGKIMKSGTAATTDISNDPTAATTYVLDMTLPAPRWRQTASMAFPRAYHNLTLLPDGNVLVTGGGVTTEGKNVAAAVYDAELWSPATETWQTMAAMQIPRLYHGTALLLADGRIVTAGSGDSYGGPDQTTAEFYSPPYLFKGARPTLTSAPSVIPYGNAFTASLADTSPVTSVALLRPSAVTHQFDEDQRYLSLTFRQNGSTLSIDAPAGAALAPPGYYMLFVLNASGVPSVARWVRLPLPDADTTLPTVPAGLSATGGVRRIALSWSASSDNVGVVRYDVHRSTTAGFTPSLANRIAQPTTTGYTDTGLSPGTYYYRVTAEDAAGNVSAPSDEAGGTAVADTQAPNVTVTAPTNGAVVSGSVTITASATDDQGVAGVQFQVDGANIGAEDTSAPFSVVWDTRLFSNASHTIRAIARDATGNQTTSSAVSVTVSNTTPPSIPGLIAAYGFNEGTGTTTSDQSGSGNNGTIVGATWTTASRAGQALSFDGTSNRVNINDSASLDLTGAMTLEAWVYPTALSGWRTVLMKEISSGLAYALYAHDGSRPAVYIRIGNSDVGLAGSSPLALNTWTHLAATYNGNTLRLYVNGVSVGSRTVSGTLPVSTLPLRIGGNAVWGEYFAGRVDEARIYNRALTASEIQSDMNKQLP